MSNFDIFDLDLDNTGDLEPENRTISIEKHRKYFLCAIEEFAPEVLEDLFTDVLPTYCNLRKEFGESFYSQIGEWETINKSNLKIKELILAWAKKYNLTDDWILENAVFNLLVWSKEPPSTKSGYKKTKLRWEAGVTYSWSGQATGIGENFIARFPGWEYDTVPKAKAKKQYMKQFEAILDKYLEETEKKSKYIPVIEKRTYEHFEWLVRYQVKKWSHRQIADYYAEERILTEDAIGKAIRKTSEIIGLTLRPPGKGGRPRGC